MALPPSLGPRLHSEPVNPPGVPGELDIAGCTICPASEKGRLRPEQAQKLGWDSLDLLEQFQVGRRDTEPTAGHSRLPTPTSHEEPARGKHRETLHVQVSRSLGNLETLLFWALLYSEGLQSPISVCEVLEAEQDSLRLCLLGLGLWLQDLEQCLVPRTPAQNDMVQFQTLQADLRGAAERVDALLAFSEELAQRSELHTPASLQQVLRALGAHRDSIFWRLWRLQAQLVSFSLVFKETITLDQDLEVEVDSDWPGPGGVWGPWAPSSLLTPAELEWDPAGDVGGFGPSGQKTPWTPGASCELCGHRGPHSWRQSPEDVLMLGLSHRKHLAGHQRRSLLQKSQNKKRQASSNLRDVMLEVDSGAPAPASRWPLTFLLLLLLLFLLLVGATLLLPQSGGFCCSPAQLARTPYLVLSYVNGPPPI